MIIKCSKYNLKNSNIEILSGWQDLNLRPPAPKAGALTGLRYTPKIWVTDRTRTDDQSDHNRWLYQLSYSHHKA